jgi:16S rRNA C1402 (ribose-2'-O) methylase RsmI
LLASVEQTRLKGEFIVVIEGAKKDAKQQEPLLSATEV